ncbi:MAG: septum formation initiator family protein [Defluviitaleaceae bacterium]|nr:septum formation initiator family protein [Defluviitaleaceae bacterium]
METEQKPITPQQEKRRRRKKRESSIVLGLYITFWVAILVGFIVLFVYQAGVYNERQARLTDLNAQIEVAQIENERLRIQIEFFDSDAYVEYLARSILGMVRPHEIVFYNVDY